MKTLRSPALVLGAICVALSTVACHSADRADESKRSQLAASPVVRPVATYSIIARDSESGLFGAAVQSHWFSVGTVVPWAEAGVGVVATQSLVDVRYGPMGLALMKGGRNAEQALIGLLASDDGRDLRQVAMIDANGLAAAYTGEKCIPFAGHISGITPNGLDYSCQANLMARDGVPLAMAMAFEKSRGELSERLLAALNAAESIGGDIRGRQSAAMLIVRMESSGKPWEDTLLELNVEDNPEPLEELARLVKLHRAYDQMNQGDLAIEHGDMAAAMDHYNRASELMPGHAEMRFWTAVSLVNAGEVEAALPIFEEAFQDAADWRELVTRLPKCGLLPDDDELIQRIISRGR